MIKSILATLVVLTGTSAFAVNLTYKADYSQMDLDATSLDICGYPTEFTMDASAPISTTFIDQMFFGDVGMERIQATDGGVAGNPGSAYNGDYRVKVYIVKQTIEGVYEPGIFFRVQVTTYGSKSAPSGMVVNNEILNYRHSAELAEGSFCGDVYYKLQ